MSWATSRYQQSTVFLSERRFKLPDCLRLCCAGFCEIRPTWVSDFARIGAAEAAWKPEMSCEKFEFPQRRWPEVEMNVEKISAVTLRVVNMRDSVRFYRDVLGMEIFYGGEDAYFSSLRAKDAQYPILNLEQGRSVTGWGRMIFYVPDVDAMWVYLKEKGFHPQSPQDASWGERYFHMSDPDGHELSFACPI